jgi:GAF domain-containing protein
MQVQMTTDRAEHERAVLNIVEQSLGEPRQVVLDQTVAALKEHFPQYTGIYVYLLEENDMLVLRSHLGRPTDHTRIPIGQGICGRAAREKDTVIVDDVNADPDYLACSLETRSEIVVPIMRGTRVFGEIDIDSDVPAVFGEADRKFLEELARVIEVKFT